MPSDLYIPDANAAPVPPWSTAYLSQRDAALNVPINFLTVPGVSLTQACFGSNRYEGAAFQKCFSNLLAVGFRRLVVDLYWDAGRDVWSLCPVQIPHSIISSSSSISGTSSTSAVTSTSASSIAAVSVSGNQKRQTATGTSLAASATRSASSATGLASVTATSLVAGSSVGSRPSNLSDSASASPSAAPTVIDSGQILYQIGPYGCTTAIDFSLVTNILGDYLGDTTNTLQTAVTFLELNIHAAAASSDPSRAAPTPSHLPQPQHLLSDYLSANLSSFMYTPTDLVNDRADLNRSWLNVPEANKPAPGYITINISAADDWSTQNGWPSESYVEFRQAERLLSAFHQVDPQMQNYNFSGDSDTIFPLGTFESNRAVTFDSSGQIRSGCSLITNVTTLASVNSSWAVTDDLNLPGLGDQPPNAAAEWQYNLTACGISPIINQTLSNTSADIDFSTYRNIAFNSVWSWAYGEPRNVSDSESNSNTLRCAALDTTVGRWRVADCSVRHRAACRVADQPYVWRISQNKLTYSDSPDYCPDNTSFSTPRTGLENSYLMEEVNNNPTVRSDSDTYIWLDFNQLNTPGCWVGGGPNSTCPYLQNTSTSKSTVIVPTVAAVIVFVVAGLTVFVKCAANRRNERRGRRRKATDGSGDYEGVPA